jgi:hypothetical protein
VINLGLDCLVESTVEVRLPGDRRCEFGLGFGPLAPGQMAAPQLPDVVVTRSSRPFLPVLKAGCAGHFRPGWAADCRRGLACRRAGESIFQAQA